MKIEYYRVNRATVEGEGSCWWRWRIRELDENGKPAATIAQGKSWHLLRTDAQSEVDRMLDFLEAWSRERVEWGGV